jgi:hypothetical protein
MEAKDMAARALSMWMVLSVAGAVGCSVVVNNELDNRPQADAGVNDHLCVGQDNGTDCSTASHPGRVCVERACLIRECGDGWVDEAAGEECDLGHTGNNDPQSGCEPDCTFTCTEDADCDDGDTCSGAELCNLSTNICIADPNVQIPAEGAECDIPGAGVDAGVEDGGVPKGCCMNLACQPCP